MNPVENLSVLTADCNSRLKMLKRLLTNHKGDMSIDLLLDLFQNFILDCKLLSQCNSNKYLNSIYQKYEAVNNDLYNLRIKYSDFNMLKVIGQGAFGQVQLVRHRETGRLYALKIAIKAQMKLQEGSVFWQEERDIMAKINSRWIVQLHYAFQDSMKLYMAMEYLPGGNLVDWMGRLEDVYEADVAFYMAEIVLAISVLHSHDFVHRDIKPDNMLLDIRGHIKLGDFGSCVRIDPVSKHVTCNRAVGTPDYISPEVLLSQSNNSMYGCEVDWWALGVMLYEIFFSDPPFYSDTLIATYGKIMTHEQTLTFPPIDQISSNAISLIKGLICDRSVRLGSKPGATDIKSHGFFVNSKYKWNWDNIHEFEAPFVPKLQNDWDTSYFDFTIDDEGNNVLSSDNVKELGSKVFSGENLQFSGFSYSNMFNDLEPSQTTETPLSITSLVNDQNAKNIIAENTSLINKLHLVSKENQDIKSSLERLSIEQKDLEIQLQTANTKHKHQETISKKLQTDYSDLLSKHGMCQQRFTKLEEEKHKLCADLVALQNQSGDQSRRLVEEVDNQRAEIMSLNAKLSDTQTECHKSKLQTLKLENDLKYLQKRYESLEQEKTSINLPTSPVKHNDRMSSELRELQSNYDEMIKELHERLTENESLSKLVSSLQAEKEMLKSSLVKSEERLAKEAEASDRLNSVLKERNATIEDMKIDVEQYRKKLDVAVKAEKDLNQRIIRLIQSRKEDRQRYETETEDQRMKLNCVISNKSNEIQQLKTGLEQMHEENRGLKHEVEINKAKCSALVEKMEEILTGKSKSAQEIMMADDMKSGKINKRSGWHYNQLQKQNKALQNMYDQLENHASRKEKEFKIQIEGLTKEKDHLETENSTLKSNIAYYENMAMSESVPNRSSVMTYSSHGSFDSGFPTDVVRMTSTPNRSSLQHTKPPLLNISSISSSVLSSSAAKSAPAVQLRNEKFSDKLEVTLRQQRAKPFDNHRLSISESIFSDINLPEGQLDVNIKVKGKKMSWEKRFVKVDSQHLLFYNQSLESCILKLPLSSLMFVRKATNADIIHAKKGEIPRIFQICYDKNCTLYSELMMKKSLSESTSSINTIGSDKSSGRNSINLEPNDIVIHDLIQKQGQRRSSITKFLPLFGSKPKKSIIEELTINSLNATNAALLKGHIFQPSVVTSKSNCDACSKPLSSPAALSSSSCSSNVDPTKTYTCYHCAMNVHGGDINDRMTPCNASVAIQLCRCESSDQVMDWVTCLTAIIKSQSQSIGASSTPCTSRVDFKVRSATLG